MAIENAIPFVDTTNLALTMYLALETAQIKRSLADYDPINVREPALITLFKGIK